MWIFISYGGGPNLYYIIMPIYHNDHIKGQRKSSTIICIIPGHECNTLYDNAILYPMSRMHYPSLYNMLYLMLRVRYTL
jgi:hypothetical protein